MLRQRRHVRPACSRRVRASGRSRRSSGRANNFNAALVDLPERAEKRGLILRGLYGMSAVAGAPCGAAPIDAPVARRKLGGGVPSVAHRPCAVRDGELERAGLS